MMIERYYLQQKFDALKFKRTYIGGSKKNEKKKIKKIMGEPDEYGIYRNCDWYDAIEVSHVYYTDKMHVVYSWKKRIEEFKMVFMILSLISIALYNSGALLSQILLISSVSLFLFFQIVDTILYFKKKKIKQNHAGVIAMGFLHLKNPNKNLYTI